MNILLASQSPNRKRLLTQAGIPFESFVPNIDEHQYINDQDPPEAICLKIAQKKAQKAIEKHPNSLIIASDQMAYLNKSFYGKALTPQKACQNLLQLQGQTHRLITSLYMHYKGETFTHNSISEMSMRSLTQKQIENYVQLDQPLHCAGSYHIESLGIGLFTKIKTEDFNSIIGLPLIVLINQLMAWGYPYLSSSR